MQHATYLCNGCSSIVLPPIKYCRLYQVFPEWTFQTIKERIKQYFSLLQFTRFQVSFSVCIGICIHYVPYLRVFYEDNVCSMCFIDMWVYVYCLLYVFMPVSNMNFGQMVLVVTVSCYRCDFWTVTSTAVWCSMSFQFICCVGTCRQSQKHRPIRSCTDCKICLQSS